jgi:hypothetical protein
MPELLGVEALRRVKLVLTDGDSNEYEPLNEAIASTTIWRCHTGLCTFHLFSQKWCQGVVGKRKDSTPLQLCNVMYNWIASWIVYVESEAEFNYSRSRFMVYLQEQKDVIGSNMFDAITKLLEKSMLPYSSKWVYYHRMFVPAGDQHTTSIGEAMNRSSKTGGVAPVNPSMGLHVSVKAQLLQVVFRTQQRDMYVYYFYFFQFFMLPEKSTVTLFQYKLTQR